MKSLKKYLSVLVMVAMLMTIVASAGFADSLDGADAAPTETTAPGESGDGQTGDGEGEAIPTGTADPSATPEGAEPTGSASPTAGDETPEPSASADASVEPTDAPTDAPSDRPVTPTATPTPPSSGLIPSTPEITPGPSTEPTAEPSDAPSAEPTATATPEPTPGPEEKVVQVKVKVELASAVEPVVYDGTEQKHDFKVSVTNAIAYTSGTPSGLTVTTKTITVTATDAGVHKPTEAQVRDALVLPDAYKEGYDVSVDIENAGSFEIKPREISVEVKGSLTREYDGTDALPTDKEPITVTPTSGELVKGHTVALSYYDGKASGSAVGSHAIHADVVVKSGEGDVTKNYSIKATAEGVNLKITPKQVTVTVTGTKDFGQVDQPLYLTAVDSQGASVAVNDRIEAVTGEVISFKADSWKTTEQLPDSYKITYASLADYLDFGAVDASNYSITFDAEKSIYEITPTPAFDIRLTNLAEEIDSHFTGILTYEITAKPGVILIANLSDYITVETEVRAPLAASFNPDVPVSIPMSPLEGEDKVGKGTIGKVTYRDADEELSWTSGLPAGTTLTVCATSKEGKSAPALAVGDPLTVKAAKVEMAVHTTSSLDPTLVDVTIPGTDIHVVDTQGLLTISGDGACEDALYLVTAGSGSFRSIVKEGKPVYLYDLYLTIDEGTIVGENPTEGIAVNIEMLDSENHAVESKTILVAFDTAAISSTAAIGNREDAPDAALTLSEYASSLVSVAGAYGSLVPPAITAAAGSSALTWADFDSWKNTPDNLPAVGTIVVTFRDLAGNEGTHTISVGMSPARTGNTIYVKPVTDGIVPNRKLQFYGTTTAWETSQLNIGGTRYQIGPIPGNTPYDSGAVEWSVTVDLSELDFPVGVPTDVSLTYDNLTGGGAAITLTYDDKAQKPVLGSELIEGSSAIWGYVESSSTIVIDVQHADGTLSPVQPTSIGQDATSGVEVNFTGYFYANLGEPLRAGDKVIINTTDFCGNTRDDVFEVAQALADGAKAELLGADIIGNLGSSAVGSEQMAHRFATPVDLAEVAKGAVKLPILAYKGIEIGTATLALNGQALELSYEIKNPQFIPAGAKASVSTYAQTPDVEDVINARAAAVIDDLAATPAGIVSFDVSDHFSTPEEEGAQSVVSGTIWLSAAFDIEMDEASYTSRGGRGVNFYRWLYADAQTSDLLGGTDYADVPSYAENVDYYKLYQEFETRK